MNRYEKPTIVVIEVMTLNLLAVSIAFGEGEKKPEDSLAPFFRNPFANPFGNPFEGFGFKKMF